MIIKRVNQVAFRRMDERVNEYLIEKSDNEFLMVTH